MTEPFRKEFDLPDDATRIIAESFGPGLDVRAYARRSPRAPLVGAVIYPTEVGAYMVFTPNEPLAYATATERKRTDRRIHAIAYLAATTVQPEEIVELQLGGSNDLVPADPLIDTVLGELGFIKPIALTEDEVLRQFTLHTIPLRAGASVLKQHLGPTFPVGFSLSEAESGFRFPEL